MALVIENHASHTVDTLSIDSASDANEDYLTVLDITDSLHFQPLLVEVVTSGFSDYETSTFCGYKNGKLSYLFKVGGYDEASLKWKDDHTMVGYAKNRDDLVYNFEDFPFEVSLSDYAMTYPTPEKLYIGYDSEVLTPFKVTSQAISRNGKTFLLKKGTKIEVDTLYNTTHMVRIIIPKKDTVLANEDDVKNNIQGSAAG
jgi:hypothetical protein